MRTDTRATQDRARQPAHSSLTLHSKWIDEQSYSVRKKKIERERKTCYCYQHFCNHCAQCRLLTYKAAQRSSTNNALQKHRNELDEKNETTALLLPFVVRFIIVFGAFHSSTSLSLFRNPSTRVAQRHIIYTQICLDRQNDRQESLFFRLSPNQSKLTFFQHAHRADSHYQ